jgi:hypothetical protein
MRRTSFDFDVITGLVPPRPAPIPAPKPDASKGEPSAANESAKPPA